MHPTLPISYKKRFPFRLGTTSYIYPDGYEANVRLLAPFFDEIELLIFEGRNPTFLPSREEIAALRQLGRDFGTRFNVHLPYDVAPGDREDRVRRQAVETLRRVIDLTAPLAPTSLTLHLALEDSDRDPDSLARWKDRTGQSLNQIVGPDIPGRLLSIENLDYPWTWLGELIDAFDLSLCLDIGHLLLSGEDLEATFEGSCNRITLIHLHGVCGGRDHLALDRLPASDKATVANMLGQYRGSVSLEVFKFDYLRSSLDALMEIESSWKDQTL